MARARGGARSTAGGSQTPGADQPIQNNPNELVDQAMAPSSKRKAAPTPASLKVDVDKLTDRVSAAEDRLENNTLSDADVKAIKKYFHLMGNGCYGGGQVCMTCGGSCMTCGGSCMTCGGSCMTC